MESKKLFFYELEGRGYTFQNKNWDAAKHGFEDDMLNMAWEMWSSGQAAKAQAVPEGFVLVSVETLNEALSWANCASSESWSDAQRDEIDKHYKVIEKAMIEAQEQSND